jgi:putative membrane protein
LDISSASVADDVQTVGLSSGAYLKLAGAGDLYELTSSKAVLAASPSPVVAAFAEQMIHDHSLLSQKMMLTAMRLTGAAVSDVLPKLDMKRALMVKRLLSVSGIDREQEYLLQQLAAHKEALALHQHYALTGTNPAFVRLAQQAVPIIAAHLITVQNIIAQEQM